MSPFDAIRRTRPDGTEYWVGRELMPLLGYSKWANFTDAIDQARNVVLAEQGEQAADQAFSRYREKVTGGRPRDEYELSRNAAYLTAMRGDSRKEEIRAALIYFAAKTREAELMLAAPPVLGDPLAEIQRQTDLTRQAVALALQERAARQTAEAKVAELTPAAEAWEQFANARGLIHPAVFAQQSGIRRPNGKPLGQNSAIKALRELRILKDAPGTDRHNTPYQAHAHRVKTVPEFLGGALHNVPYVRPRHAHYLRVRLLGHFYPAPVSGTVLYLPAGTEGRAR
ncbi:phage antirepressor KilAC domain-containing protein [Streptomyces sp. B1866]|uniref:phage antirepressor KilAC domain-containing protein n=1 Tax=Streptomyces sp. B1866 TaxID=3075431 RepID=UPI00289067A5|nr:phage antirepressor KilAC domain-containing protein [Streptomyces sp. B1866]MDT3395473.1 phage antirepressor KilAC domain-containing protein [Streptomyces sp. B1866]